MMSEQEMWQKGIDPNEYYKSIYEDGRKSAFRDVLDLIKDKDVYDEFFVGWLRRKVEALQKGEG